MTEVFPEGMALIDALASVGIRPQKLRETHPTHTLCPKCSGGSSREESLVLTVDPGRLGAVWHCHRGSCGWSDNMIIGAQRVVPFATHARHVRKPIVVPDDQQHRSDRLYDFFAKRGISRETVDVFGCYLTTHWFGKQGDIAAGNHPAIVFPYRYDGAVVNRKYRGAHKQMAQEADPMHTLYNIESVVEIEDGHVVIAEGEVDCMAIHEAGWKQVVSLKDGAPAVAREENDPKRETDRRYEALAMHADILDRVGRVYLAGDNDAPGLILREELARRLGRHRCWIVRWPDGCKDACDVMQQQGQDVVNECIQNATPYPIEDVQEVTGQALSDYLDMPAPRVLKSGINSLDDIVLWPGEGRTIVITGVPNSGKSQVFTAIMAHMVKQEDRRFLVFSPEMQPWEEYAIICAQVLVGKTARRGRMWSEGDPLMTMDERVQVGDWMRDRIRFLSSDAADKAPTLEWILDRAAEAVLRLGITDVGIDPWNEVEHQRGGMTETDYIGRALQKIRAFCYRYGCNAWIIAHPTKLKAASPGEAPPAPGPYDINGSAAWANKADIGITVHTPENATTVTLWKSRFARWGRKNAVAELEFDAPSGRYRSPMRYLHTHGPDAWWAQ